MRFNVASVAVDKYRKLVPGLSSMNDRQVAEHLSSKLVESFRNGTVYAIQDTEIPRKSSICKMEFAGVPLVALLRQLNEGEVVTRAWANAHVGENTWVAVLVLTLAHARFNFDQHRWFSHVQIPQLTDDQPAEVVARAKPRLSQVLDQTPQPFNPLPIHRTTVNSSNGKKVTPAAPAPRAIRPTQPKLAPSPPDSPTIRASEAATILKLSRVTLDNWRKTDRGPSYAINADGHIVYRRDEINQLAVQRAVELATPKVAHAAATAETPPKDEDSRLISATDAAAMLGTSVSYLSTLRWEGVGPRHSKKEGRCYYERAEIEKLARDKTPLRTVHAKVAPVPKPVAVVAAQPASQSAPRAKADKYLDRERAAKMLGISTSTLDRMRSDKSGPTYFLVGSAVRYPVSSIHAWVESRMVE